MICFIFGDMVCWFGCILRMCRLNDFMVWLRVVC